MNVRKGLILVAALAALAATAAFAGKPASDLSVTTYFSDFVTGGPQYYVFSDSMGAYKNGVGGVISILEANSSFKDWRLDLFNSTSRTVAVTLTTANAVQPGDPGFTVAAHPPYWGTEWFAMHLENKCSVDNRDMLTMKTGDKLTCDTLFRFPIPNTSTSFYRLDMGTYDSAYPETETQQVQISCNSSATDGNCNDWFLDPIPVVNPDGSTSPGQTRARLNLVSSKGNNPFTNEGDFYLTFHIHVTRP
jgi:hypothetical protein